MKYSVTVVPVLALLLVGCGRYSSKSTAPERPPEDPWPRVAPALRETNDSGTCRRVLTELNSGLSANPSAEQPTGLSPEQEASLRKLLPLTEEDGAEVRGASYSSFDPNYLADAYYFRDIARALEVPPDDPVKQADAAFAWMCRQLVATQSIRQVGPDKFELSPPAPPSAVLRRGSGSGLERAYVFLAILQQLGLDGCLVGPSEAADRPGHWSPPGVAPGRGPFWAVGVRIGGDVVLYHPWRGEKIPGTLAEAVAKPQTLEGWLGAQTGDVTPDIVKRSIPFLAVPLSAIAPRNALLEQKLQQTTGEPRLAIDVVALRDRFAKEGKQPEVKFWNPTSDPYTYTRVPLSFLPIEEGGWDAEPLGRRVSDRYKKGLIPARLIAGVQGLEGIPEAQQQLLISIVERYVGMFLTPPTPREQIQRGMFADATPDLVRKRDAFDAAAQRIRTDTNRDAMLREWVSRAGKAYGELSIARLNEKTDPNRVVTAQQGIEQFWKENATGASAIADQALAAVGSAEATYLLALCKHEQAERSQVRYDRTRAAAGTDSRATPAADRAREKALDDWNDALGWWGRYEKYQSMQEAAFPGRTEHARQLADRARRAASALGGR